ncbi:MAG: hypothetical protein GX674_04710 [Clostridiales bacterium]|nr:hypothetical protein [Clostridiales bacterium]
MRAARFFLCRYDDTWQISVHIALSEIPYFPTDFDAILTQMLGSMTLRQGIAG